MTEAEAAPWPALLEQLTSARRAAQLETAPGTALWIAAERLPQFEAVFLDARITPAIGAPQRELGRAWEREEALREIVRGRLEGLGPVTTETVANSMAIGKGAIESALAGLENEGFALRGQFTGVDAVEWCDRRLLARIHRYTLDRLRREIEPASPAHFLRFLLAWQHVDPDSRMQGASGLAEVLGRLQGFQLPAGAWEGQVLPARMVRYSPTFLDELCLSGQVVWGRLYPPVNGKGRRRAGPTKASPLTLVFRQQLADWLTSAPAINGEVRLSGLAQEIMTHLEEKGARFSQDLIDATHRLPSEVRNALGELVAAGLITGDGFAGLRGLVSPAKRTNGWRRSPRWSPTPFQPMMSPVASGRWSLFRNGNGDRSAPSDSAELWARQLLLRYGIVFHRLTTRETGLPPWSEVLRVFRRMEARGEIRGGRFVTSFSGEQYALPEAVESLRALRRKGEDHRVMGVSGADPLNLVGIITPGERVPALATNRVAYRDGAPLATRVAGVVSYLEPVPDEEKPAVLAALRSSRRSGALTEW
jgi:ATP-dependent Lhr-like helicase